MKKFYGSLAILVCILGGVFLFSVGPNLGSTAMQDPGQTIDRSLEYAKKHETFSKVLFQEHEEEFVRLAKEGQAPKTLFISCSDSRVTPEFIASAKPGDFFVIRNAGNFVPLYDPTIKWDGIAATIEYAVQVIGVKDVIVCGHSHCGAVQALFYDQAKLKSDLPLVQSWLQFGELAKKVTLTSLGPDASKADCCSAAEHLSVVFQLEHLLSYPFIKRAVEDKKLYLHGWHFNIEKGEITYFNPKTQDFMPLRGLLEQPASK